MDTNADVGAVFGAPANGLSGASMTIAGTSLTTTETAYPSATFNALTVNSGGSVTTPNGAGVTANTLVANGAFLNTGVQALSAVITDGSVVNGTSASGLSLEIDNGTSSPGSLTLQDSIVGPHGGIVNGTFSISNSQVIGLFSFNLEGTGQVVNSTFNQVGGIVNATGSLLVQNSSLSSSQGSLTILGGVATLEAGTTYSGVGNLNVGSGGSGSLANPGSLTLDGAGTKVTLGSGFPQVNISSSLLGSSTLNVQNGAQLSDGGNTQAQLLIGNGTLNVLSGGKVSVASIDSSAGAIVVNGENSSLTSNLINLGAASSSLPPPQTVLLVQNGARVNAGTINLGVPGGGAGALNVTGGSFVQYSSLDASGPNVYVNNAYLSNAPPVYVGSGSSLSSNQNIRDTLAVDATVTGAGSNWSSYGLTVLAGTLTISDGGELHSNSGFGALGTAAIEVDGSNSMLSTGPSTLSGAASITISNGGAAKILGLGTSLNASGTTKMLIDGVGSTLTANNGDLTGSASLTISGGGAVNFTDNTVETLLENNSTVTITGSGSQLTTESNLTDKASLAVENLAKATVAGTLTIGSNGATPDAGHLYINGGGVVTTGSANVSFGSVEITGGGELNLQSGSLIVGGIESGSSLTSGVASLEISDTGRLNGVQNATIPLGTLSVTNGASVDVGSRAEIGGLGTINVSSGSLNVGTVLLPQGQGWVTVGYGGTLSGCASDANCIVNNTFIGPGKVIGSVAIQAGGRASPGDPESFNISGDYLQTGGTLDLQIDGAQAGQFDQLIIGGSAQFSGGDIELDFGDGFAPITGETFDLLSAANGISFSGTNLEFEGLAPGFDYTTSFADGQFDLTALNDGISSGGTPPPPPSSVPEPATWSLIASALLLLLLVNGLRKRELDCRTSRS